MRIFSSFRRITVLLLASLLGACATTKPPTKDYSYFRQSRPASILVLPPLNRSPSVEATASVYAQTTQPLAESGYYVLPVALVDETFRQNGLSTPADVHELPVDKLRKIFAADAALYMTVEQYGTSYRVLASITQVTVAGRLVDLKTGQTLWSDKATAIDDGGSSSGGGLVGLLIQAAVNQIVNTLASRSYPLAAMANYQLLSAGRPDGLLYGPRSPRYMKEGEPASP